MENFTYLVFARALHVIGVVLWIGGVAFVTTVLIPSLKNINGSTNKLELFKQLEGKFSFQAKLATLVTGISGFFMIEVMNAWDRYQHLQYWWMHLMTLIWFIFTLILFVLEPLFLATHLRRDKPARLNFGSMQKISSQDTPSSYAPETVKVLLHLIPYNMHTIP